MVFFIGVYFIVFFLVVASLHCEASFRENGRSSPEKKFPKKDAQTAIIPQ
jgi:hypothetical protein